MDYRYETNDDKRIFHKSRKAFIIIDNKLEFLPDGSVMSHYEYCNQKGIDKDYFNQLIRGFYLNGNLVFYKDNFIYDSILISDSLKYLNEISTKLSINKFNIYFGVLPDEDFKLDFYYGKYCNGDILKI